MLGLLEISEKAVEAALKAGANQAQAATYVYDSARTRFANSQIHQNQASVKGGISVEVVVGKKIGVTEASVLDLKLVDQVVRQAIKIARVSPENTEFKSLPEPRKWRLLDDAFDENTANCTADYRAESVKHVIETAHSKSPVVKAVAGSFLSGSYSFAVVNSLGVSAHSKMSLASMNATVISRKKGAEGFGYETQSSRHVDDIDAAEIAAVAAEKSTGSVDSIKVSPKEYEVVLSPLAASSFFFYLSLIGFSASPYQRGESFVKYNLNKQVFDEKLSVKDDVNDPRTMFKLGVDGEGVPKQVVPLIEDGVVSEKSICYDTLTANRENRESTGHALPGGLIRMVRPIPFPMNVIVAPGPSSVEEMVEETSLGLFITRFHYTNPVSPPKAVLTGLTRDGTFLIENGKLTKSVKNMRYTDSLLSALKNVVMVGKNVKATQLGMLTTPALKLEKLRFTGTTEH